MKQRARVIVTAWGRSYLDELLLYGLPALLAPGNLPILAEAFDCELVLVTETTFFDDIYRSVIFRRIGNVCKVRLVPIDDLVMTRHHYGLTLTYAYLRGFADLGPEATDYYLLFLNSDFILADGCYRTVVRSLQSGERLIVAPSYCVIKEAVAPILRYERTDPETGVLALKPRDLAGLAISNRHYTIRGKTVNQQLYSMDRIEQFYWCVDNHTLLAHQLPIAVVCIKPERLVTDLPTFWDYGMISELCPNAKPCVIDDSDDFLMIELRDSDTYQEYLSLGWPSVEQISRDLSSFTTKDQRHYGRYTLMLHARDLPSSTAHAKAQLRSFVENVYRSLSPEPVDHLKHPYWNASVGDFNRGKIEWDRRRRSSKYDRDVGRTVGRLPEVSRMHPFWSDLRAPMRAFNEAVGHTKAKVLLIRSTDGVSLFEARLARTAGDFAVADSFLAENNLLHQEIGAMNGFDISLTEVNFDDLRKFTATYRHLRQCVRNGGRMIFFYRNSHLRPIGRKNLPLLRPLFSGGDQSVMYFSGDKLSGLAVKLSQYGQVMSARNGNRFVGRLGFWGFTLISFFLAILQNWRTSSVPPQQPPEVCTSLTIVIDVS